MSGEPPAVRLAGTPEVDRVLAALAVLVAADPDRHFVLAGGLGVMARIGEVHRVTLDIDAVTDTGGDFVEVIEGLDGTTRQGSHLFLDGVKIDVLGIQPSTRWDDIGDIDGDPQGRLFNASLLWAYQEATPLTIASSATSATVPVATARSLLVTKLSAYHSARRMAAKRSTDAADLYLLLEACAAGDGLFHGAVPAAVVEVTRDALHDVIDNVALFQSRLRSTVTAPDVAGTHLVALCDQVIADLDTL